MPADPPPPEQDPAAPGRSKLVGRIILVALAVLVALYLVPLALSFLH